MVLNRAGLTHSPSSKWSARHTSAGPAATGRIEWNSSTWRSLSAFRPSRILPLKDLAQVVMVVLDSNSAQLPVDPVVALGDPFLPTNPGDQSGYLLVMNRDLTAPLAGGWFGGSGEEEVIGAADMGGYLLIGSNTTSVDLPGAVNSFSGGRWDGATIYIENFKAVTADSLREAAGPSVEDLFRLVKGDLAEIGRNNPGKPYRYSTTYSGGPGLDEFNLLEFGTTDTNDTHRSHRQQPQRVPAVPRVQRCAAAGESRIPNHTRGPSGALRRRVV